MTEDKYFHDKSDEDLIHLKLWHKPESSNYIGATKELWKRQRAKDKDNDSCNNDLDHYYSWYHYGTIS